VFCGFGGERKENFVVHLLSVVAVVVVVTAIITLAATRVSTSSAGTQETLMGD
jgi:hypothetical protein